MDAASDGKDKNASTGKMTTRSGYRNDEMKEAAKSNKMLSEEPDLRSDLRAGRGVKKVAWWYDDDGRDPRL